MAESEPDDDEAGGEGNASAVIGLMPPARRVDAHLPWIVSLRSKPIFVLFS
jgi:hypothetical protein